MKPFVLIPTAGSGTARAAPSLAFKKNRNSFP